jgi:pimeloyl-ACP methyl ester carboxylesterase
MAKGRYVEIAGHRTWVVGQGADDPIVLLHGSFDESDGLLDSIGAELVPLPIAAFDRAGRGRTPDTSVDYSYAAFTTHAVAALEHLGGGRPMRLVGFSEGGIVAIMVALARPDLVRNLVLIGSPYDSEVTPPPDMTPAHPFWDHAFAAHSPRSPDGPGYFPKIATKMMAMWHAEPVKLLDRLPAIACPVLLIFGDHDIVAWPNVIAMFEAFANAQLAVVPAATHASPYERPALVATLIRDFITPA